MSDTYEIEQAIKLLQPINYKPFDTGYYIVKNGDDTGSEDYCIECIDDAVKEARTLNILKRNQILNKFKSIEKFGYFKQGRKVIRVKPKYSDTEILKAKRNELKDYRAGSKFTYEGHDPDFGGGLNEPCSCENCGEFFICNFEPDKDEAERLLDTVTNYQPLSDRDKWELEIALGNYQYAESEAKPILELVAKKIINLASKK